MNPYSPPGLAADVYPGAAPYAAPGSGGISERAVEILGQTRPWVLFLSVMLLIASALVLGLSVLMVIVAAFKTEGVPMALGLIYLPLGLFYVYPGIKLWSFGAAIARLSNSRAGADLEDALGQQKSFWKYCGVASIVVLVLYALVIVGVVIFGAATALGVGKGH